MTSGHFHPQRFWLRHPRAARGSARAAMEGGRVALSSPCPRPCTPPIGYSARRHLPISRACRPSAPRAAATAMVRFKNRYVLCEVISEDPRCRQCIEDRVLGLAVRDAITRVHGDYGLACCSISFTVKYLNAYTGTVLLRCRKDSYRLLCSALPFVRHLESRGQRYPCSLNTLHVGGQQRPGSGGGRSFNHTGHDAVVLLWVRQTFLCVNNICFQQIQIRNRHQQFFFFKASLTLLEASLYLSQNQSSKYNVT
uniref:POP5 homolog, ribonuclease P/MRP subunit n=1 Tax=Junco hyemalis TaxID=40217 RepID=A0A8C5J5B1_JUNHY